MILLIVAVEQASKDEPKLSTLFLFKIIIVGCGAIEKRQEQGSRGLRVMMETEEKRDKRWKTCSRMGLQGGCRDKEVKKATTGLGVCLCVFASCVC